MLLKLTVRKTEQEEDHQVKQTNRKIISFAILIQKINLIMSRDCNWSTSTKEKKWKKIKSTKDCKTGYGMEYNIFESSESNTIVGTASQNIVFSFFDKTI